VRDWVEKKIRRHLMRSRGRQGLGWDRWSRRWLYERYRKDFPRDVRVQKFFAGCTRTYRRA
jgi:hypothetical protein